MNRIVDADLFRLFAFLMYRYRFLSVYVVIGFLSLCLEVLAFRGLERLGVPYPYNASIGVASGILMAYWGNVRFNFKVPSRKRHRAFLYFVTISVLSWSVQYVLRRQIADWGWSYERARFLISGSAFFLAYFFHRRFSFVDYKKVAVAVYANGIEDIRAIQERIKNFADIIHVDLVDSTYGREDQEIRTYRLEVVRAYWPHKPVHAHIMSRRPSQYLAELLPHVDRVYVHLEVDEDLDQVLRIIRRAHRETGLAMLLSTPLSEASRYINQVDAVLFLAIPRAGYSGQSFQMEALERITDFNQWPERRLVDVCVDGGVTERNVGLLNVEIVVSGSSVLSHPDPCRQIMRLQTSSSYEQT